MNFDYVYVLYVIIYVYVLYVIIYVYVLLRYVAQQCNGRVLVCHTTGTGLNPG